MATRELTGAPVRADHPAPSMSAADIAAHEAASHITWRARENYLRSQSANGRIRTAGGLWLADRAGHIVDIEVTVDYVSPVSPDGDVFLILRSLDGTGTALAVTDATEHAEARGWMDRSLVSLFAKATTLFGQPAIDLRRATAIHGSVTANTAPLPQDAVDAMRSLELKFAPQPVIRAVVRYGICREALAELDGQRITTPRQFDALKAAQDGLAEATEILTAAGMLHIVAEHDKVKDPKLPQRPRGPHAMAVAR